MRSRHWLGIAATVLSAAALLPAPAVASDEFPDPAPLGPQRPFEPDVAGPTNISTIELTARPDGAGPRGIEVSLDSHSHTATGEKPASARRHVFLFDRSIRFNAWTFPTCERAVIEQRGVGACPEGSRVGSGRVEPYPTGAADIAVFNTRYPNGMRGMLITIPANGAILENTFEPVSRPYRRDFQWASDEIVPIEPTPPQDRGASTRFQLTLGATYRGHSYMESFAPPGRLLTFGGWSEFVTGEVSLLTGQVPRP